MKALFVSQVFWPDTVSVAQHVWDLAEEMQKKGHQVAAVSSIYPYEHKSTRYKKKEIHNGVTINRIYHTSFGKATIFARLMDFLSFNFLVIFKLLFLSKKKVDVIIGTTVPPLLSYVASTIAKMKGIPFCYWVMDMQPELAITSGMIREGSVSARLLSFMGIKTIKNSDSIIVLDKYMKAYIERKGGKPENISCIPVWPVMDRTYEGERLNNPFRIEHGFQDRIVVMYSGNHAFVHPLDTLLDAALALKDDKRFLFVFVGGGVREKDVTEFKALHQMDTIVQLPFQPRNNIHNSLGSSDVQVVILGDSQVGFTHPNKVYGALFVRKPILYIGPDPSHVTDILDQTPGNIAAPHGSAGALVTALQHFAALSQEEKDKIGERNKTIATASFAPDVLKGNMVKAIEDFVAKSKKSRK